ncbi:hypothetical protein BaRGS_00019758 [Batillaria attramentaria]|uniref:Exosome complex component MTR3 n=1 Tax=Batillaria attramentaria TaxID=370345 RepID=A0ABD0KP76_9CAEN
MPDTRRITGPESSLSPYTFSADFTATPTQPLNNGVRADGRQEKQHRPVYLQAGLITQARGSAYAEFNRTKVICAVEDFQMQGQITCEVKFATFSCQMRRQPVQDNQEKDMSTQLLEALEPAVCLHKFPKSQVDVYVRVLENDGSALSAAITCASVALADAGIEMYDLVVGCTAKLHGQTILVDPTVSEENAPSTGAGKPGGQVTLGLMPSLHQVSALAFHGDVDFDVLSQAVQTCQDSCQKLYPILQQTLVKTVTERMKDT